MVDKRRKKVLKHNTKFEKNLSISSRRYLERQARDPFSSQAQQEGYRSRAVYKLKEIDDKYHFLQQADVVVDLGAAPGSWSQMARRIMGHSKRRVIALDKLEVEPLAGVDILEGDFTTDETYQALMALLPEDKRMVDVVLSDMAPETSGNNNIDHLRIMGLAELAADFARQTLKSGGFFVCKLFMGGEEKAFSEVLRAEYDHVHFFKPKASRADSREVFLVARGFKQS